MVPNTSSSTIEMNRWIRSGGLNFRKWIYWDHECGMLWVELRSLKPHLVTPGGCIMTHITTTGTAILFICCVGGLMALGQTPGATVPSTQSSAEDPEEIAAELGPRHPSYHDNPDELRRMRVRGQQTLRQISDVLLENVLDIVKVEGGFDLCLTEIIRRGWGALGRSSQNAICRGTRLSQKDPFSPGERAVASDGGPPRREEAGPACHC